MAGLDSDWAWLPKNLLASILNKLPNFSDYVRFCSVCAPWRYIALDDSNDHQHMLQKQRLQILKTYRTQLPMLMVSAKKDNNKLVKHDLYSITEKKICSRDLRLPCDKRFFGSSRGWMFTVARNRAITLLNPVTGQTIPLPVFQHPSDEEFNYWIDDFDYFIAKGILSLDPWLSPGNYEAVVIYGGNGRLAYFKSGDVAWTFMNTEGGIAFSDVAYHKGQFYAVNHWTGIVHIDFASGAERIIVQQSICANATYLVESQQGDLLVVQRFWDDKDDNDPPRVKTLGFKIFKLLMNSSGQEQPQPTTLVQIKGLGDQALFLGDNHSVSVSTLDFPGCKRNCIYFTDQIHLSFTPYVPHWPDDDSGIFNIEDKSLEPCMPSSYQKPLHPPIWIVPNLRGT